MFEFVFVFVEVLGKCSVDVDVISLFLDSEIGTQKSVVDVWRLVRVE